MSQHGLMLIVQEKYQWGGGAVRSGDRLGHVTGPHLPIHLPGMVSFEYRQVVTQKWAGAPWYISHIEQTTTRCADPLPLIRSLTNFDAVTTVLSSNSVQIDFRTYVHRARNHLPNFVHIFWNHSVTYYSPNWDGAFFMSRRNYLLILI